MVPSCGPFRRYPVRRFGSRVEGMDITAIPQGTIVVGVDGSPSSARALDWAIDHAVRAHLPLTLAHAVNPTETAWIAAQGVDPMAVQEALRSEASATVTGARARVAERASELLVHELISDTDPRVLLLALAERAALVVVGSRGRGPIASLLLGSVGVAVARHATCPVVVVRPGNPGAVRNGILVGIDGTELSVAPLEFAYGQASISQLPLTVLHCFSADHRDGADGADEEVRLAVAETVSGLGELFPDVRARIELAAGSAADAIVRASQRMDLVVLGAHHGSALGTVLNGSVATSVLEHATCPVAIVSSPDPTPTTRPDPTNGRTDHEHH